MGCNDIPKAKVDVLRVRSVLWSPRTLIINFEFLISRGVVKDGHLLTTNDGDFSFLMRIKPAHMEMCALVVVKPEIPKHNVCNPIIEKGMPGGLYFNGLLIYQVHTDRQVVRGQRPQCVFIPTNDS